MSGYAESMDALLRAGASDTNYDALRLSEILQWIEQGHLRVFKRPFPEGDYGLPKRGQRDGNSSVETIDSLEEKHTYMLTVHLEPPSADFTPEYDEVNTHRKDATCDASPKFDNWESIRAFLAGPPFFFTTVRYGNLFSHPDREYVSQSPVGGAIMKAANNRLIGPVQQKLCEWIKHRELDPSGLKILKCRKKLVDGHYFVYMFFPPQFLAERPEIRRLFTNRDADFMPFVQLPMSPSQLRALGVSPGSLNVDSWVWDLRFSDQIPWTPLNDAAREHQRWFGYTI